MHLFLKSTLDKLSKKYFFMRNQSLRKSPKPSFRSKNTGNGGGKGTGSGPEVKKERHVIRESGSTLRATDLKKARFMVRENKNFGP